VKRSNGQRQSAVGGDEFREARAGLWGQSVFRKQSRQGLATAGCFGKQQHAPIESADKLLQAGQRVFRAAIDGQRRQAVHGTVVAGRQGQAGVGLGGHEKGFFGQKKLSWRQQRPVAVA
jgi:hypothetical protein